MDMSSLLEVEVQEVAESKENVTPKPQQTFPCQSYSSEENDFYKLTYGCDIAAVRFLRLHCTACDEHIGSAPSEAHNMHEHPVLRVLLCAKCRQFYGDGTFEQGEDATDMFCRWCANGGNLYCCSYCSNTFCSKCIKRNLDFTTIKRIEEEDSWKCFVCDPKDLYPLRSIARALIIHIETVTRILENNKRMSSREIEEKMHLDETKCCSRKRKRRRRRTLSGSDDDNDDDEDVNYVPDMERTDSPPAKKRRSRCGIVRSTCNSNGYFDHEYNAKRRSTISKVETDYDPCDLINQCEQTMIEGEEEIVNTNEEKNVASTVEKTQTVAPKSYKMILPQSNPKQTPVQLQPLQKIQLNNTMGTLNPVPIANLLKVPILGKKIKVTCQGPPKLVALPVQNNVTASGGISIIKPTTHFLVPKPIAGTLTPIQIHPQQVSSVLQPSTLQPIQTQPVEQQHHPNVIDLDSDDEAIIVENMVETNQTKSNASMNNVNIINKGDAAGENVVPEPCVSNSDAVVEQPVVFVCRDTATLMPSTPTIPTSTSTKVTDDDLMITLDKVIQLKSQQRYKRFEKMLRLQSKEIDSAVGELKTKILRLVQTSITKPSASQNDSDLQNAAFVCTKRFHRALRKALMELSHINDRLVKDYLHWKKKTDKVGKPSNNESTDVNSQPSENNNLKEIRKCIERRENIPRQKRKTNDISLEMICERESATESENEDHDFLELRDNHEINATHVPPDFSAILDHLSIFKRKPTAVKAVGNDSVLTEDKACQAYDVPWRDYEKCIGYSLLTRSDYDPEIKEETARPVAQPDENFGKYQEQYLFYLQHVEDYGIETDESKGLPDPNHIPLKDLIDSSSPFILDMLERLSPVTLSNSCTTPKVDKLDKNKLSDACISIDSVTNTASINQSSDCTTDTPFSIKCNKDSGSSSDTKDELQSEKRSEDNPVATSKAVQELQKMVTKLSEDLRHEQQQQLSSNESKESSEANEQIDLENETGSTVNLIFEINSKNVQEDDMMDVVEILDLESDSSDNDDCMALD